MVRTILLAVAMLGCGGSSKIAVLASTPRQITYDSGDKDDLGELLPRAQAHCEQYDRDAQRADDDDRGQMTFHCVDRLAPKPTADPHPE